jgi:competence protein ComEC
LLDSLGIARQSVQSGDVIFDFAPLFLYVLHPDSSFMAANPALRNENSVVIKISYGKTDFLFTGDIGYLAEDIILKHSDLLQSEVLKVGHHGSRTSSKPAFLAAVRPQYAVISSGAFNRFGHPDHEVLQRLQSSAIHVLRTDISAALLFSTDGEQLILESWK